MNNILSLLIWLPIFFAIIILFVGNSRYVLVRSIAFIASLIIFILSSSLWFNFDTSTHLMQFGESHVWIEQFNIYYRLGIDGFSMPLIILTSFSTMILVASSWGVVTKRVAHYMASFLMMEGFIIGVFASLDAILFYLFWEASLIPMLLVIGIWGGEKRVYAAIKFFLYTFFGSVFMLISLIYMANVGGSFNILDMQNLALNATEQSYIFWALFIAFAVKIPSFPVHTWLPSAHVQAPTGGSVILAAIMLKMGGYGLLRLSIPITPDASFVYADTIIILSIIAIIYIGFVALAQSDMKKLVAYSSISHMGFVTLGIFAMFAAVKNSPESALLGINGSMVQMISHGFISAAMFLVIGFLYDRTHSKNITDYGGLAISMPKLSAFIVLFAMANSGLPGTSGFVGEFMVILGAMSVNFYVAALAATTLIIGAAYTLWMVKRVFWGSITNDKITHLKDLNLREIAVFTVLAIVIIVMGIYPDPLIQVLSATSEHLLQQALTTKI